MIFHFVLHTATSCSSSSPVVPPRRAVVVPPKSKIFVQVDFGPRVEEYHLHQSPHTEQDLGVQVGEETHVRIRMDSDFLVATTFSFVGWSFLDIGLLMLALVRVPVAYLSLDLAGITSLSHAERRGQDC